MVIWVPMARLDSSFVPLIPKPVYQLRNLFHEKAIFIVAPGPSLGDFPVDKLNGYRTLVLNSAWEVTPKPWLWMFADKRFSRIYMKDMHAGTAPPRILIADHQLGVCRYFKGIEVLYYQWQIQLKRYSRGLSLWWINEDRNFLPGRCSVFNNALSFCEMAGFSRVITIGVDFSERGDKYYVDGIRKNAGPTGRERALRSGRNWYAGGMRKKLWPNISLYSTSDTFSKFAKIKKLSSDEAFAMYED